MRRRSSQARAQAATSEAVIPRMITAGGHLAQARGQSLAQVSRPAGAQARGDKRGGQHSWVTSQ
jgi:hypothetical protein